jgi:hypothetical protein
MTCVTDTCDSDALSDLSLPDIDTRHCNNLRSAIAALLAAAAFAVVPAAQAQTQLGTIIVWGSPSGGYGGPGGGGGWSGANSPTQAPEDAGGNGFNCADHLRARDVKCPRRAELTRPQGALWTGGTNPDPFSALGRLFHYLQLPSSSATALWRVRQALERHTREAQQGTLITQDNNQYLLESVVYACGVQVQEDPLQWPLAVPGMPGFDEQFRQANEQAMACYDAVNAIRREMNLSAPSMADTFWNEISTLLSNLANRPIQIGISESLSVPGAPISIALDSRFTGESLEKKIDKIRLYEDCELWYDTADRYGCPY